MLTRKAGKDNTASGVATNRKRSSAGERAPASKRLAPSISKVKAVKKPSPTVMESGGSSEDSTDDNMVLAARSRANKGKSVRGKRLAARKLAFSGARALSQVGKEQDGYSESASSSDGVDEMPAPVPRSTGTLPCVPRTGHVSDKVKKQIRKGDWVNFASLLEREVEHGPARRFTLTEAGTFEEIQERRILHFYEWVDCFIVFMSIRIEGFPGECQGLLRHLQLVKSLHSQGKDGTKYDTLFRKSKCQHPYIHWGEYLPELVCELGEPVQQPPYLRPPLQSQPQASQLYHPAKAFIDRPKGTCFSFNSTTGCHRSNCRFVHRCRRCQGTHLLMFCNIK